MWYLEYEIADLQEEFAKEMGSFNAESMDVDFIEDMLIKSKPLQIVLLGIRKKQKVICVTKSFFMKFYCLSKRPTTLFLFILFFLS